MSPVSVSRSLTAQPRDQGGLHVAPRLQITVANVGKTKRESEGNGQALPSVLLTNRINIVPGLQLGRGGLAR
jgi:hypothetical protein